MLHRYLRDVSTLTLSDTKCTGCGKCTEVCPRRVLDIKKKKAVITDKDLCVECGACALNCPEKALEVKAGVGCAAAIIQGWLTGKEPTCGCGDGGCCQG